MKYRNILLFAVLFLLIAGCNEDEEVTYVMKSDAYIRGMKIDGESRYAPVLLATFSDKTASLTVLDGASKKYILESYWNNDLTYRWVPESSDYVAVPSQNMSFKFTAMPKNSEKATEASETASLSSVPKAFDIQEMNYDKEKSELTVVWENAAADNYLIQIADELDADPIFQSISFVASNDEATTLTVTLNRSSLKWFKSPAVGKTYVLSVHAFNLANNSNDDIAGEYVATKTLTWGK